MTESQNVLNPHGYLVEGGNRCEFFKNKEDADWFRKPLEAGRNMVTITPLYTRATSPAERQIEAIRAALKLCQEAVPYMVVDATFDLRVDIEKILEEDNG